MRSPHLRNLLWTALVCLVAGLPVLLALYYPAPASHPAIWPIPQDTTAAKKAHMINLLLPEIRRANQQLLGLRTRLVRLKGNIDKLSQSDKSWLRQLANDYRLALPEQTLLSNDNLNSLIGRLLLRIDIIPADLALAQAASESAWGTSRFSQQGNNFYGIWCFSPGCGLVPAQRGADASHEVRAYPSVALNVADYMLTLNTHASYQDLRQLRAYMRQHDQPIDGARLAEGLNNYSGIGHAYVEQLQQLIASNQLDRYSVELNPSTQD